jgi:hypothetical protein
MTVSKLNLNQAPMEEFIVYGLLICLAMVVTGAVVGFLLVKRRSIQSQKSGLFGSTVKMPSPPSGLFPISLYKQTEQKSHERCSANDLSNMEAQCHDVGLAKDSCSSQDWRFETDSAGSVVIGRGVQKWAVHFKMRYDAALELLEVGLLRVSTIAVSSGDPSAYLFFNIYLMPNESEHQQSTLRHCDSTNAVFEETFMFELKHADAAATILRLSLYTIDGSRTRTCLGHVAQALCGLHIFDGRPHYLTRDLGTLETSNIDGCLGEILVSLSYHMQKEKLKLHVLDARHLPPKPLADAKYYLQTDIVMGDRIVKTKKTPTYPALTEIFDCAYAFQIPCKHLDVCCLAFTIVEVVESDFGQIAQERPWGRFTIGPCSYAHGTGVDHWKMMLSNSRKVIEMWHVIARAY